MELPWLTEARCRTEDPELFFPVGNTGPAVDQIEQAKTICRECKVVNHCLEYAIKENQDNGVWGGLSEDERKSLKRKYARARRSAQAIGTSRATVVPPVLSDLKSIFPLSSPSANVVTI